MKRVFRLASLLFAFALIAPLAHAQDTSDPLEQCIALMNEDPGCKEFGAALAEAFQGCGKRSCKRTCNAVKRDCKSDCREARRSCFAVCNDLSGQQKRACKSICRNTVQDCRDTCKSSKTVCKNSCTSSDPGSCRKARDILRDVGNNSMQCLNELLGERYKCDGIIFSEEDLEGIQAE